jgi:anti-sigma B factor antagonist
MKIISNKNNDCLEIALEGRLDTTTALELDSFLNSNYDDTSSLTIDCKKLSYISSAGLRVLLTAHKKLMGNLKLTNVCELVMEVFELTGFADILVIE